MHILLVEDNEDMQLAIRGLLESAGHSVDAAADAEKALAMLAASTAAPGAVVTDVELPGMSGTDLVRRLISAGSSLPFVVTSSLQRCEALEELDASGRVSFLRKPFSAAQLEGALEEAKACSTRPVASSKAARTTTATADDSSSPTGPVSRGRFLSGSIFQMPVLAVALLVGMGLLWKVCSAPPPLPSAPITSVQRGDRIFLEAPLGEILQPPEKFLWAPTEDAQSYRVVLSAVDDTVLWQEVVAVPSATLPTAFGEALERAVVYHWWVEALDGEDRPVARSERARFLLRLEPRPPSLASGGFP